MLTPIYEIKYSVYIVDHSSVVLCDPKVGSFGELTIEKNCSPTLPSEKLAQTLSNC